MTLKLDLKNRRILYELDRNARIPISELARRVKLSKEVVRYRMKFLESSGVISHYFTIIDVSRMGYAIYKVFIKLHNITESQEKELISWLSKNGDVVWLVSCDGPFDVAFGMRAANVEFFSKQLAELENKFGKFFLEKQISPIVRGQYFYRSYLLGLESGTERSMIFGSVPRKTNLDDLDLAILAELGKNGRASIVEISREVKMSADAIGKRLKRLEKEGVIQSYTVILDNALLNQFHYKLLVHLKSLNEDRFHSLVEFCKSHPNIFYSVKTFGSWDFEIDLEVSGVEDFRKMLRGLKAKFSDIVSNYSYVSIYKIHKYNFCPSKPSIT